jgi:sterol desaturase/sphingolipid hydroxylase (fatty acid hydroxylase superfamily)
MDALLESMPPELAGLSNLILYAGLFFGALILLEILFDFVSKKSERDFKQSWVDIGIYFGHELAGRFGGYTIFLAALMLFSEWKVVELPINGWTWAAALIVADFLYYWSHRLEHRVNLFWSWHNIHHSSREYSGTTALRLGWLEPFVSWYLLVPMVVVGFDPLQVILAFQILLTWQTWLHTQKIGRLGWFDKVFNSPANHRVHHGSNPEYLDKNFGAMLIIWDRLFGTWAPETIPVRYGLTTDLGTLNPIKLNYLVPFNMLRSMVRAGSLRHAILSVLGPPEWNPTVGFSNVASTSLWRRLPGIGAFAAIEAKNTRSAAIDAAGVNIYSRMVKAIEGNDDK